MKKKVNWEALVAQFNNEGGGNASDFARRHKVAPGNFSWHLHKKRHGEKKAKTKRGGFVAVGGAEMIEIEAHGVTLKVPTNVGAEALRDIVEALRQ